MLYTFWETAGRIICFLIIILIKGKVIPMSCKLSLIELTNSRATFNCSLQSSSLENTKLLNVNLKTKLIHSFLQLILQFPYFAKMKLQKCELSTREIQRTICSKFEPSYSEDDVIIASIKNESILRTIRKSTWRRCWTINASEIGIINALKQKLKVLSLCSAYISVTP